MATEVVEIPIVPAATANLQCEVLDPNGINPVEVIQDGDAFVVRLRLQLQGVLWDLATVNFEAKVAIESIGAGPEGSQPGAPVVVVHNGTPGNSPYNYTVDVPVGPLPLAPGESSTAYRLVATLLGRKNGTPTGIGGFCDVGVVQVIDVP